MGRRRCSGGAGCVFGLPGCAAGCGPDDRLDDDDDGCAYDDHGRPYDVDDSGADDDDDSASNHNYFDRADGGSVGRLGRGWAADARRAVGPGGGRGVRADACRQAVS